MLVGSIIRGKRWRIASHGTPPREGNSGQWQKPSWYAIIKRQQETPGLGHRVHGLRSGENDGMKKLRIAFTLMAVILLGIDPAPNAQWADCKDAINFVVGVIVLPFQLARLAAQRPDAALLMPVAGAKVSRVADTWGTPRSGGRTHQGQDIFARKGTAVFSATGGYVVWMGRNRLGGNVVMIAGAGGRRYYYAHLATFAPEMRVGKRVAPDTVIGFVGNTGNAAHTPPHLHFAVYTRAGAVNPLPLLRDRIPPSA
jgi:murein DD-endopeptidase MepM/ murein hydrolase activator NlpD